MGRNFYETILKLNRQNALWIFVSKAHKYYLHEYCLHAYSYSTLSCQCGTLHILNIFIFVCIYFCMCIKCCAQSDSVSP